jgi:hypothetical protein
MTESEKIQYEVLRYFNLPETKANEKVTREMINNCYSVEDKELLRKSIEGLILFKAIAKTSKYVEWQITESGLKQLERLRSEIIKNDPIAIDINNELRELQINFYKNENKRMILGFIFGIITVCIGAFATHFLQESPKSSKHNKVSNDSSLPIQNIYITISKDGKIKTDSLKIKE